MKTRLPRIARRTTTICCLLTGSLMLFNCSTKDPEFIDPYEFVSDDFKNIGELPPVEDEDPEFSAPATGSVENSAATQAIITDLEDGNISAETEAGLAAVENFSTGLPAGITAEAQALDQATIAAIMDAESFEGELASLETALDDLPAEIAALLPTINFTADYSGTAGTSANDPSTVKFGQNFFAQSVTGPCAEAVQEAYNLVIEELDGSRYTQLATVEANYERRLIEADARYDSRLTALTADYEAYKTELQATANELLQLAISLESSQPEVAADVRMLALIYVVEASSSLTAWYTAALDLLAQTRTAEKVIVLGIKETLTAEINANYAAKKAEADAALQKGLNDCHNQGSGN